MGSRRVNNAASAASRTCRWRDSADNSSPSCCAIPSSTWTISPRTSRWVPCLLTMLRNGGGHVVGRLDYVSTAAPPPVPPRAGRPKLASKPIRPVAGPPDMGTHRCSPPGRPHPATGRRTDAHDAQRDFSPGERRRSPADAQHACQLRTGGGAPRRGPHPAWPLTPGTTTPRFRRAVVRSTSAPRRGAHRRPGSCCPAGRCTRTCASRHRG